MLPACVAGLEAHAVLAQTVAGYCFIVREFRLNINSVLHFVVRVDAFGEFGKLPLVF